jgi:arylsulfatase A-like enzyme
MLLNKFYSPGRPFGKSLILKCLLVALTFVSCMGTLSSADLSNRKTLPNVVLFLADDLGLGDVSYHVREHQNKKPLVETPAIDGLAQQGMWFTDGHSATALCAPTRYAVMSGNNNYRSYKPAGVWSTFAPTAFKPGEVTLGTVLRDAGYSTGFFGKWHMGGDFYIPGTDKIYRGVKNGNIVDKVDVSQWAGSGPKYCGFDYDFTTPCGIQGPMYLFYENEKWFPLSIDSEIIFLNEGNAINSKDISDKGPGPGDSHWDARDVGKLLSSKAVDFINAKAGEDQPFFMYYCSPMVHLPHVPTDSFDGVKVKGQTPTAHLDVVIDLDMQVKRIVDALKANGMYENTLFVFSSDNGGLYDKEAQRQGYDPGGGWRGSKNHPFEGGHRVPTFAVWPGRIQPGVSDELVSNVDFLATFAALTGVEIPAGQAQDSLNLLPLLTGERQFHSREFLLNQAGSQNELMYRRMPWKFVIQSDFKRTRFDPIGLYNLEKDPREKVNQIDNPELAEIAQQMFKEYMDMVQSGVPTVPGR